MLQSVHLAAPLVAMLQSMLHDRRLHSGNGTVTHGKRLRSGNGTVTHIRRLRSGKKMMTHGRRLRSGNGTVTHGKRLRSGNDSGMGTELLQSFQIGFLDSADCFSMCAAITHVDQQSFPFSDVLRACFYEIANHAQINGAKGVSLIAGNIFSSACCYADVRCAFIKGRHNPCARRVLKTLF